MKKIVFTTYVILGFVFKGLAQKLVSMSIFNMKNKFESYLIHHDMLQLHFDIKILFIGFLRVFDLYGKNVFTSDLIDWSEGAMHYTLPLPASASQLLILHVEGENKLAGSTAIRSKLFVNQNH